MKHRLGFKFISEISPSELALSGGDPRKFRLASLSENHILVNPCEQEDKDLSRNDKRDIHHDDL